MSAITPSSGYVQKAQIAASYSRLTFLAGYHKGAADAFLQLHATSAEPSAGRVPDHCQKLFLDDNFFVALPQEGMGFDQCYVVVSTTAGTYAAGAADIIFSHVCK